MAQTLEFRRMVACQLANKYKDPVIHLEYLNFQLNVIMIPDYPPEQQTAIRCHIRDAKQRMMKVINAFRLKDFLPKEVYLYFRQDGGYGLMDEKPTKQLLPIPVKTKEGVETRFVEAWCYGPLAIHQQYLEPITDPTDYNYFKDTRKRSWVVVRVKDSSQYLTRTDSKAKAIEAIKLCYKVLHREYWDFDKVEDIDPAKREELRKALLAA